MFLKQELSEFPKVGTSIGPSFAWVNIIGWEAQMHSVICCYGTGGQQACTMATHGSDPGQAACRAALSTQGKMEVLLL